MAESNRAGHGFFQCQRTTRRARHQIAKAGKLARIHAALLIQRQPRRHDDFIQRGIAGAFAKAVNCDARGIGTGSQRGNGVRRRHAEVIVSVKFQTQIRRGRAQGGK